MGLGPSERVHGACVCHARRLKRDHRGVRRRVLVIAERRQHELSQLRTRTHREPGEGERRDRRPFEDRLTVRVDPHRPDADLGRLE